MSHDAHSRADLLAAAIEEMDEIKDELNAYMQSADRSHLEKIGELLASLAAAYSGIIHPHHGMSDHEMGECASSVHFAEECLAWVGQKRIELAQCYADLEE